MYLAAFTVDPDEKGLSTQESNDHLGGGGIAAVTIASTLLVVAAVLLVVVMLGYCYLTKHKSGMKRSGKYVVDNSEIYGDGEFSVWIDMQYY